MAATLIGSCHQYHRSAWVHVAIPLDPPIAIAIIFDKTSCCTRTSANVPNWSFVQHFFNYSILRGRIKGQKCILYSP